MAKLSAVSTDIQKADGTIYFWIARGWRDDIPQVRGVDTVVPGLGGRTARNRIVDRLPLLLNGQIKGSTPAAFLANIETVRALWDPTLDPWALVVADEYKGLATGVTATIQVRTINVIGDPNPTDVRRKYSWELECIDPAFWVLAGP